LVLVGDFVSDLRVPIGVFFLILGLLLTLTPSAAAPLSDAPVNLYVGLCALAFGGAMAWLGRRG
jgi:hypothetical protein